MFRDELIAAAKDFGLVLTTEQIDRFCLFAERLVETNKVMNLTALTEPADVAVKHMIDSLSCYDAAWFPEGASVLDLGTGAGFPGLPLKILCPSIQLTMVDSLGKRVNFLQTVCDALHLTGAEAIHARAEEFAASHRAGFDIVTSRAVAALPVLAELCLPLVKEGGWFLAMKSVDSDAETAAAAHALEILGGRLEKAEDYVIPGTDVRHRLLFIKKVKETPKKYPRAFAKIKKNPL